MADWHTDAPSGLPLRSSGILAFAAGHGCRLQVPGRGVAVELIAIGREWARVRVPAGQEGPGPGEAVALEPELSCESGLAGGIPGFIIDKLGNELWVCFSHPLAVSQPELQQSLEPREGATA